MQLWRWSWWRGHGAAVATLAVAACGGGGGGQRWWLAAAAAAVAAADLRRRGCCSELPRLAAGGCASLDVEQRLWSCDGAWIRSSGGGESGVWEPCQSSDWEHCSVTPDVQAAALLLLLPVIMWITAFAAAAAAAVDSPAHLLFLQSMTPRASSTTASCRPSPTSPPSPRCS